MTESNSTPLNTQTAQGHGWQPATRFQFAATWSAIPVHMAELGALVPNLPLAFARTAPDHFILVAVTGFADGRNQAVAEDGRWVLQYLPLDLGCYPFRVQPLQPVADGKPTYGVCFNHDSGLYRTTPDAAAGDQLFFTPEGQLQPMFQQMTERLQRTVSQQQITQRAVAALHQAELLVPWQVQPRAEHPTETLPAGFFRIDESRLNALDGDALGKLHQVHAVALAYSQLLSMSRVVVLQRLKDTHEARARLAAQAAAAEATAAPDPAIVEKLFGGGMGDTLKFNF